MDEIRRHSATSVILRIGLRSSATGLGLTGLDHTTANLIISTIASGEATATAYTSAGSTLETIATLGTYAAPTATKARFKAVDGTNHPGLYELQLANARFAVANARDLIITLSGAATLVTRDYRVRLIGSDLDGTDMAYDIAALKRGFQKRIGL